MWTPTLLILPPAQLLALGPSVPALAAAGISVAIVPSATKVTALDPAGVAGWLADSNVAAVEPSVLGRRVASSLWGQLAVQAGATTSATAVTAAP
jgi:hypothetical protein